MAFYRFPEIGDSLVDEPPHILQDSRILPGTLLPLDLASTSVEPQIVCRLSLGWSGAGGGSTCSARVIQFVRSGGAVEAS